MSKYTPKFTPKFTPKYTPDFTPNFTPDSSKKPALSFPAIAPTCLLVYLFALLLGACSNNDFPAAPINLFSNNNQGADSQTWRNEIIPKACNSSGNLGDVEDCIDKGEKYLDNDAAPAVIVGKMCRQLGSKIGRAACYTTAANIGRHESLLKLKSSCAETQATTELFVACMERSLKEK